MSEHAPHYEPPSLIVLLRTLELLAKTGRVRLTIELSTRSEDKTGE